MVVAQMGGSGIWPWFLTLVADFWEHTHKQFLGDNLVMACQQKSRQSGRKRKPTEESTAVKVIFRFFSICFYVLSFISIESDMIDALLLRGMSAAAGRGGGGTGPPGSNFWGSSPRNRDFWRFFPEYMLKILDFPIFFEIKWPKSEEKLEFGGKWVWRTWINPPQSKLRGGAPVERHFSYRGK